MWFVAPELMIQPSWFPVFEQEKTKHRLLESSICSLVKIEDSCCGIRIVIVGVYVLLLKA